MFTAINTNNGIVIYRNSDFTEVGVEDTAPIQSFIIKHILDLGLFDFGLWEDGDNSLSGVSMIYLMYVNDEGFRNLVNFATRLAESSYDNLDAVQLPILLKGYKELMNSLHSS